MKKLFVYLKEFFKLVAKFKKYAIISFLISVGYGYVFYLLSSKVRDIQKSIILGVIIAIVLFFLYFSNRLWKCHRINIIKYLKEIVKE
jgi:putative effector of murein hydrolase LrgA (UPF0299 family)